MSALSTLALQATVSVLCSLLLLALLHRPLTRTLQRLCPDGDAAGFWWAYASAMLVAGPLALVLLVNLLAPGASTVDQLRGALLTTLCGLLWGMYLLGERLGAFVSRPGAAPATAPSQPTTNAEAT
ncbi:MAG: hypothetical protein ACT4NV_09395 [Rhodoferax sp.]